MCEQGRSNCQNMCIKSQQRHNPKALHISLTVLFSHLKTLKAMLDQILHQACLFAQDNLKDPLQVKFGLACKSSLNASTHSLPLGIMHPES